MNKTLKIALTGAVLLLLAGCGKLNFDNDSGSGSTSTKAGSFTTTGTNDSGTYQGIIQGGKYKTSQARGLTLTQNNQNGNTFNVRSMEDGLQTIAQGQFATDKYYFEEGQLLTTATTENWLARQKGKYSKKNDQDSFADNSLGLNPAKNKYNDSDANKRNPIYLQQILEQDYMVKNGSSFSLGGVAIALGMNSVDYFQKEKYGATYQTNISDSKLTSEGKAMAAKVIQRFRRMKKVGNNTPIIVGIYKQTKQDSLVGGTFVSYVVSKSGTNVSNWKSVDEQNEVLPVVNGNKAINSTVANNFSDFTNQIKSFFPTLAGITSQVHYKNGALAGMNITINTQFYGQTEINSFTQYVSTAASKYLPSGADINISIQSVQGMQAFVARKATEKSYYTHVFSSY
ncbi:CamS family sex pheromone protein [Lacticaseibacillus sharpeae]|uniref:CamS family sex pheromone protein n=1 Tax=Lacticaseibacillus sharpeae TaxID=1626 RepID=UPI0006D0A329|nr:CamS family sex pheromone protein [Lacticaseibacillus sharpeae]